MNDFHGGYSVGRQLDDGQSPDVQNDDGLDVQYQKDGHCNNVQIDGGIDACEYYEDKQVDDGEHVYGEYAEDQVNDGQWRMRGGKY